MPVTLKGQRVTKNTKIYWATSIMYIYMYNLTFKRLILCSVHRASTSLTYCASSQLLARTQRWAWRLKRKEKNTDQTNSKLPFQKKKTISSLSLLIPVFSLKIDNFTFIMRKTQNRLNKNVMHTEGHLKCWWMPMDDIVQLSIVSISNINTANKSFTKLVITATFDNFFSYWDNTAWLMSLSIS